MKNFLLISFLFLTGCFGLIAQGQATSVAGRDWNCSNVSVERDGPEDFSYWLNVCGRRRLYVNRPSAEGGFIDRTAEVEQEAANRRTESNIRVARERERQEWNRELERRREEAEREAVQRQERERVEAERQQREREQLEQVAREMREREERCLRDRNCRFTMCQSGITHQGSHTLRTFYEDYTNTAHCMDEFISRGWHLQMTHRVHNGNTATGWGAETLYTR